MASGGALHRSLTRRSLHLELAPKTNKLSAVVIKEIKDAGQNTQDYECVLVGMKYEYNDGVFEHVRRKDASTLISSRRLRFTLFKKESEVLKVIYHEAKTMYLVQAAGDSYKIERILKETGESNKVVYTVTNAKDTTSEVFILTTPQYYNESAYHATSAFDVGIFLHELDKTLKGDKDGGLWDISDRDLAPNSVEGLSKWSLV